mmetsp:Transcript_18733/g.30598  ORF Transcript_18733/g.30598 Transcript_18733/m.30598 type:complete len:163 (+) Transcript_18733:1964-2452(+)
MVQWSLVCEKIIRYVKLADCDGPRDVFESFDKLGTGMLDIDSFEAAITRMGLRDFLEFEDVKFCRKKNRLFDYGKFIAHAFDHSAYSIDQTYVYSPDSFISNQPMEPQAGSNPRLSYNFVDSDLVQEWAKTASRKDLRRYRKLARSLHVHHSRCQKHRKDIP